MTVRITKPETSINDTLNRLDQPIKDNIIYAGNRNIVHNGAMQINQRGVTTTGFGQSNKGYKMVDRWKVWEQGAPTATFVMTHENSNGPPGFPYHQKFRCDVANTDGQHNIPSSVHMYMEYFTESSDLFRLCWGTPEAKVSTLSFWMKSNVSGKFVVAMNAKREDSSLDYYAAPYESSGSGEWEYITIQIPPNLLTTPRLTGTGAHGQGLCMRFILQSSSTYSGGSPLRTWTSTANISTNRQEAGQEADVGRKVGNYWCITGVQLEEGPVATPFEHRSFAEDLAICQRYYQVLGAGADYSEMIGGGSSHTVGTMHKWSTSNTFIFTELATPMRNSDDMTLVQIGEFAFKSMGYTSNTSTAISLDGDSSNRMLRLNSTINNNSWTVGASGWVRANNSNSYLAVACEI